MGILKVLIKPLVISFLRAELPIIQAKLTEKGYSEATIQLVTDIINNIISSKVGD